MIRRNVELEARLIDDLLDVTRISKGKLQLSLETVNVHEILQRSYEICREEIEAKDLKIEFRFRAKRRSRRRRSGPIAAGLLEPDQEQREIHAGKRPDRDRDVEPLTEHYRNPDNGHAASESKRIRWTNLSTRSSRDKAQSHGALGVSDSGLAISKAMVAAHGGMIKAESHGKERGSDLYRDSRDGADAGQRLSTDGEKKRSGEPGPAQGCTIRQNPIAACSWSTTISTPARA